MKKVFFEYITKFLPKSYKSRIKFSSYGLYLLLLKIVYKLDLQKDQFSIIIQSIHSASSSKVLQPKAMEKPIVSIITPYGDEAHGIKTQSKLLKNLLEPNYIVRIFDTSNGVFDERERIFPALTMITQERERPSNLIIANIGNGPSSYISILLISIFQPLTILHDVHMNWYLENTKHLKFYHLSEYYIKKYLLTSLVTFKDISALYRSEKILVDRLGFPAKDSDYPYCLPLIQSKPSSIYTTSKEALENLRKRFPETNVVGTIPLLNYPPVHKVTKSLEKLKICSAGFITDQKKPDTIGEIFGKLSKLHAEWNFYWIGEPSDLNSFFKLMSSFYEFGGLEGKLHFHTSLNDEQFSKYVSEMDVMLQLRRFSNFETSGSILSGLYGSVITLTDIEYNDDFLKDAPIVKLEQNASPEKVIEEIYKFSSNLLVLNKAKKEIFDWAVEHKESSEEKVRLIFGR
jgi:hypothetical protein